MPRAYETVLILESTLDDTQVEEKINRYSTVLTGAEGEPASITHWGRRKLAYPIQKKEQGIYAVLRYSAEPTALNEFERLAKLDEQVLRQLTVVNPTDAPVPQVGAAASAGADQETEEGK